MSDGGSDNEGEDVPKAPHIEAVALTQEQNTRIVHYINGKSHSENDACPVCDSPRNTVTQLAFTLDAMPAEGALAAGHNMPLYVTMCHNCGFVRMFNQILVDQKIAEEDAQKPAPPEVPDGGEDAS